MDPRTERIGVRLSKRERALCDALADHHGIDTGAVMRMAMLKMAREEGISVEPESPPKGKRKAQ